MCGISGINYYFYTSVKTKNNYKYTTNYKILINISDNMILSNFYSQRFSPEKVDAAAEYGRRGPSSKRAAHRMEIQTKKTGEERSTNSLRHKQVAVPPTLTRDLNG